MNAAANHDALVVALVGVPTLLGYLVHCQRQHVRRKMTRRRRGQR